LRRGGSKGSRPEKALPSKVNSLAHLYKWAREIGKSGGEIHISLKEIHISKREIHKSAREIHISSREICISLADLTRDWRDGCQPLALKPWTIQAGFKANGQ